MKNDYRDYLAHSLFGHKYIRKVKTPSGEWRYIYPEDIKRDVSYKLRNLVSKITGKNKTFEKEKIYESESRPGQKFKDNIAATRYEKIQRESRAKGAAAKKKKVIQKKFNDMDIASSKKVARSKIHNQKAIKAPDGKSYWYVKEKKENVIPGTPGWKIVKDDNKSITQKHKKKQVLSSYVDSFKKRRKNRHRG